MLLSNPATQVVCGGGVPWRRAPLSRAANVENPYIVGAQDLRRGAGCGQQEHLYRHSPRACRAHLDVQLCSLILQLLLLLIGQCALLRLPADRIELQQ